MLRALETIERGTFAPAEVIDSVTLDLDKLPTPQIFVAGRGARNASASSSAMTVNPSGFSRSEASLARNLLSLRPTEAVIPASRLISSCSRASITAGGAP